MDSGSDGRRLKRPRGVLGSEQQKQQSSSPARAAVDSPSLPQKRSRITSLDAHMLKRRRLLIEPLPRYFGLQIWGQTGRSSESQEREDLRKATVEQKLAMQSLAAGPAMSPWLLGGLAPNFDR